MQSVARPGARARPPTPAPAPSLSRARARARARAGAAPRPRPPATFQSEQAFGPLAGRLATLGLIERRPGTGRRIEHYLTPSGEEVLSAGHRIADEVLASCYANLSEADRSTLLDLLERVDDSR
ncbi:MarR family winged helix-turn-helix transcriptional regulator [Streptomyces sp. NPDC059742]|uniref:MarR family winged helix-turn-helix transcriptional regulator n=1 Tax=Streptomyces sp. NPDC059742 TaxID=3346927 RepID=UPI0036486EBD